MPDANSGGEPTGMHSISERVDRICDEFEGRLADGQSPKIEDFLAGWDGPQRSELLRELLRVEIGVRRKSNRQLHTVEEYRRRFPNDGTLVDEVFAESLPDTRSQFPLESTLVTGTRRGAFEPLRPSDRFGNYEIVHELGRGGMGVVYKARELNDDGKFFREVALKLIRADKLGSLTDETRLKTIARFQEEARAAAALVHDHIVTVFRVGEIDGRHFYAMRFVEGESLAGRVRSGPLENREAAGFVKAAAVAVQAAHEKGILHRDLKPDNIMIDGTTGRPLVADFGLAKLHDSDSAMTLTGDVFGSPPYMSPEQARSAGNVEATADVYSLGATLYHLLTGRPPFQAANPLETLKQVVEQDPVPPRQLNRAVARDLETICLKCLEKDPSRRFQTARELADELGRWLDGRPILSRPVGWPGRVWRFCVRKPLIASLSGLSAVLAVAIMIGGPVMYYNETLASDAEAEARKLAERREKDARQSLATQAFQAAGLAAERGRWRTVLKNLDESEAAGYPDRLEIGLLRMRALRSLTEIGEWSKELSRLETIQDMGPHRGRFLLVKAELLRLQGKQDEALKLVAMALKLGLPKPEAAYARGLSARTTPEAAEYFKQAVDIDPSFHEASSSLVATLVLLGRLKEAKSRANVAVQLFPDDPFYPVWMALVAAMEQDEPGIEKWSRRIGEQLQLSKDYTARIRNMIQSVRRAVAELISESGTKSNIGVQLAKAWAGIAPLVGTAGRNSRQDKELASTIQSVLNALPPAMRSAFASFGTIDTIRLLKIAATGTDERLVETIQKLSIVNPETSVLWLRAAFLVDQEKYVEAEALLVKAADAPGAIIPALRPQSMHLAARAALLQYDKTHDPAAIQRAAKLARRRLKMGNVTKEIAASLRSIAILAKDFPLALEVVHEIRERYPDDVEWQHWEMMIEFITGHFFHVIQMANRILARNPNDVQAKKARATAINRAYAMIVRDRSRRPVKARKPRRGKRAVAPKRP